MKDIFAQTAIMVTHDGLGHADQELSHKLAKNYFRTLLESGHTPKYILFYGEGVKLTTQGSPCQDELAALSSSGVSLIACRTCLDYYGLTNKVAAGEIGNMLQIVEAQAEVEKVITV